MLQVQSGQRYAIAARLTHLKLVNLRLRLMIFCRHLVDSKVMEGDVERRVAEPAQLVNATYFLVFLDTRTSRR